VRIKIILQEFDIFRFLAWIIGIILNFLRPLVQPIGEWMIGWVEFLLNFFPFGDLNIYFFIFIILVISGIIVNSKWPGDKPSAIKERTGPTIEDSVEKCSSCGKPTEGAKICPYCGAPKN